MRSDRTALFVMCGLLWSAPAAAARHAPQPHSAAETFAVLASSGFCLGWPLEAVQAQWGIAETTQVPGVSDGVGVEHRLVYWLGEVRLVLGFAHGRVAAVHAAVRTSDVAAYARAVTRFGDTLGEPTRQAPHRVRWDGAAGWVEVAGWRGEFNLTASASAPEPDATRRGIERLASGPPRRRGSEGSGH